MKSSNRFDSFCGRSFRFTKRLSLLSLLLLATGCVTLEKGAVSLFPEQEQVPAGEKVDSGSPPPGAQSPPQPLLASKEFWALMGTIVTMSGGIVGHRMWGQRKGSYANGHTK